MCLIISGFWAGQSPFAEISRLEAGQRLRHERGRTRLSTDLPAWFTNPSETASIEDLAAAIEAAVPHSLLKRSELTLSGGLDSRLLLAAVLGGHHRRPRGWSTHHESGWDGDTRVAGEVARATRLEHHIVDYGIDEWLTSRELTADRLEHATSMHNWMMPLARAVHPGHPRTPLLDGLGGDVLMKYHDDVASADRVANARRIWETLGGKGFLRAKVLRPGIREAWEAEAFAAWRQHVQRWDDHPYAETVMRLLTRTRRAIAASPFRLFAPERRVMTPFIDPDVVRIAFAVPPQTSSERDLRPKVLRLLHPTLASIGSTVDPNVNRGSFTERGPSSATAVRSMVREIGAQPPVASLFNATELDRLAGRADGGATPHAVRRAATLAHWVGRWRARLGESPIFD